MQVVIFSGRRREGTVCNTVSNPATSCCPVQWEISQETTTFLCCLLLDKCCTIPIQICCRGICSGVLCSGGISCCLQPTATLYFPGPFPASSLPISGGDAPPGQPRIVLRDQHRKCCEQLELFRNSTMELLGVIDLQNPKCI